jgi:hypothetical protein
VKNIEKFQSDIVQSIFIAFDNGSIEYDSNKNNYQDVMLKYLTMLNRLIGPKKRNVHISSELNAKISGSDSESIRLKELVNDMQIKIENGEDVNGHLSKLVFRKLDETDKMLDDWNIYHFHLCLGNPNVFDDSRTQSGDLLMATILFDDAYFIDITNHSKDDWFLKEYLEIIKNNWESELLIRYDDIIDVPNLDESVSSIKGLRKANVNSIIHKIGDSYYCVKYAMGYSVAGTSSKAMNALIFLNKYLQKLDFDYDHMEFYEYNINCLCKLYDGDGNSVELIRHIN